jgi:hypothetical protein
LAVLRPVVALAAIGVIGFVAFKFVWALLLPVVGVLFGLAVVIIKVLFFVALLFIAIKLFKKITEPSQVG